MIVHALTGSLSENDWSQVFIAILSSVSSVAILMAAKVLPSQTRPPYAALSFVVFMMSLSYWLDVFSLSDVSTVRDWRRGIGFVLYPTLTWCASAAANFWRKERKFLEGIQNGS